MNRGFTLKWTDIISTGLGYSVSHGSAPEQVRWRFLARIQKLLKSKFPLPLDNYILKWLILPHPYLYSNLLIGIAITETCSLQNGHNFYALHVFTAKWTLAPKFTLHRTQVPTTNIFWPICYFLLFVQFWKFQTNKAPFNQIFIIYRPMAKQIFQLINDYFQFTVTIVSIWFEWHQIVSDRPTITIAYHH